MNKRYIMEQIEREIIAAQVSVKFWRSQLPLAVDGVVREAVEASVQRALVALDQLEQARHALRNTVQNADQSKARADQ